MRLILRAIAIASVLVFWCVTFMWLNVGQIRAQNTCDWVWNATLPNGCNTDCTQVYSNFAYQCSWNGSACMGFTTAYYCNTNPDGSCTSFGTMVLIPCGGGGGGSCPSECRQGSACGVGYSSTAHLTKFEKKPIMPTVYTMSIMQFGG